MAVVTLLENLVVSLCPARVLFNSDGSHTFLLFPDLVMISGEGSWLVTAWNVGRGRVEWLEVVAGLER